MKQASEARGLKRMRGGGSGATAIFASLIALFFGAGAFANDRFTVCSITINSDDEIRTLESFLPESEFQFVELTDHARVSAADGEPSWFGRACRSGVHCDVLVVSGHFGNTWAGNYGTTFAGSSGISLSLGELEQRRCEQSCDGILSDPLEVFLFGCKTLSDTSDGPMLAANDVAVLSSHHVPPTGAGRIFDEARNRGEATSSRERMQFVFAGVPRLYGFTDVAPAGKRAAPLLEKYLSSVGGYAEHLRQLKKLASDKRSVTPNEALARALEPTCFAQSGGLDPAAPEYGRDQQTCLLKNHNRLVVRRLEQVEKLLEEPGFVTYLPAISAFLRAHDPASFRGEAVSSLERIRSNARARSVVISLLGKLETPTLRLEILRVARSVGWISEPEALPLRRQIVAQLLRPPVYGEGRDLICGMGSEVLRRIRLQEEDVPPEVYRDEYGIQALACLRPADERIHARLARSLSDSREWIVRLTKTALGEMKSAQVAVQTAFTGERSRADARPPPSASKASRALKPPRARVLAVTRQKHASTRTVRRALTRAERPREAAPERAL